MPPKKDNSGNPRVPSHASGPDSSIVRDAVWVEVQPSRTPGIQPQKRTSASRIWSMVSQLSSSARRPGAQMDYDPYYKPHKPVPDTTTPEARLTGFDADTSSEPSMPETPTSQDNTSLPSPSASHSALQTHHELPYNQHGNHNHHQQQQQQQQEQEQPPWTWNTRLFVVDPADKLDLGVYNCAAVSLSEEDIASAAALRDRVLATLRGIALRLSAPHRAQRWLDGGPEVDIDLSWSLDDSDDGRLGDLEGGGGDLNRWWGGHRTNLCLAGRGSPADAEEEGS